MNGRTFVDTNILLYAHDREAGAKHRQAKAALHALWERREGVLSTQVLEEFYVSVTRKVPKPIPREEARDAIRHYLVWDVIMIDGPMILEASETEERLRLSFWDALILVAAKKGRASCLLSENFQHGQKVGALSIRNPLVPA